MIRNYFIFVITIVLTTPVAAQFSMEGFLSNSVQEGTVKAAADKQQFIKENNFKSPILREVEFRMRARKFSEGLNDYKLRFSPINPYERSANKKYKTALDLEMNAQFKWNLNEALNDRYQLMIDHYNLFKQQEILQVEIEFYSNVLNLASKQPNELSMKDVIRMDKALLKSKVKLESNRSNQSQLEYLIKQNYSFQGKISWDSINMIEPLKISNWLQEQSIPSLKNNFFIQHKLQQELVAQTEFNIKKQKSFSNIGYIQAEYRKDEDLSFSQNLGMQIGVNIPITNPDKPDLERRKLKMLEDSQSLIADKESINTSINFARIHLKSLISQYNLVNNKKKDYVSYAQKSSSSNSSLDIILELREFQLELQNEELMLYVELLKSYIDLLGYDGKLAQAPYINYLSNELRNFNLEL